MVNAWSWSAAALAYAVISGHCAAEPSPKNNLALVAKSEPKLFRFDIPDGDLSGLEDYISSRKRQEALPSVLYRGSGSSPEAIQASGGFIPRDNGEQITNLTFGLKSHHLGINRTAYTSTSRSFGVGLGFSLEKRGSGWIYKIHPTPNMIDLNESGFELEYRSEEEFSALGGIRYDQIEAWMPISANDMRERLTKAKVLTWHDFEQFSAKYPEKKWTVNSNYSQTYDSLAASPGQPQLAGDTANLAKYNNETLEEYAVDFMRKNGAAVGWDGKFPLSSLKAPVVPPASKPDPSQMNTDPCAIGPDGKGRYKKLYKWECELHAENCAIETQGSPDAKWVAITKCMDAKFWKAMH